MSQLNLLTPEQAKTEAITRVESNSPDFVDAAYEIIKRLAAEYWEFSSMDVWVRYTGPRPKHPRAMGAAFMRAHQAGLIEPTQRFIKSGRKSDHNQLIRVWRSQPRQERA